MHRDLSWLLKFLPVFIGTTKYVYNLVEDTETIHIDTCLQSVGGVLRRYFYSAKLPQGFQITSSVSHTVKLLTF